ncbi:hypothetical protein BJ166DRAFT_520247 [Pestalotiopsis sp. NC0098]|nr:hypothetical protein BJ166DRAFT_520247 [Pestalotiopsis sp. NC0098]
MTDVSSSATRKFMIMASISPSLHYNIFVATCTTRHAVKMSSTQTTYEDDPVPFSEDGFIDFRRPHTRHPPDTEADSRRSARPAPKRVVTIDDFRGRPAGYVPRKPVPVPSRPRKIVNGVLQKPNRSSVPGDSVQNPKRPSIIRVPASVPSNRRGWMSSWASIALSLPPANCPVGTYPHPVIGRRIRCPDELPAEPTVPVAQADPAPEEVSASLSLHQDTEPPWQAESMQVLLDALASLGPRRIPDASTADQQSDDSDSPVYRRKDNGRRADRPGRRADGKRGQAAQQKRRGRRYGPGSTRARPIEIEDDSDSDEVLSTSSRASSCTLDDDVPVPGERLW